MKDLLPMGPVLLTVAFVALGTGLVVSMWVPGFATADAPTVEVRLNHFSPAYRWSTDLTEREQEEDVSLHLSFGGGIRLFPHDSPHGVIAEVERRLDPDFDSAFDESFHSAANVTVGHVGYAYRFIHPLRQKHRFALVLTLSASLAFGSIDQRDWGAGREGFVGARLGLDVDIHARRFFFGWAFYAEALQHFDGQRSLFLGGHVQPFLHVGFLFGQQVQEPYGWESPRELFDLRSGTTPASF